jgi:hypothetical protein
VLIPDSFPVFVLTFAMPVLKFVNDVRIHAVKNALKYADCARMRAVRLVAAKHSLIEKNRSKESRQIFNAGFFCQHCL